MHIAGVFYALPAQQNRQARTETKELQAKFFGNRQIKNVLQMRSSSSSLLKSLLCILLWNGWIHTGLR